MGKYGDAAVKATQLFTDGKEKDPPAAWRKATRQMFKKNLPSQKKSCPRAAYLGLCESGLVKGIPTGNYTDSVDNKKYALAAVPILKSAPSLNGLGLWKKVMKHLNKPITKTHNQQMDVVRTLFSRQLLQ